MIVNNGGAVRLSGALTGKTSISGNSGTIYIGDSSLGSQPTTTTTTGGIFMQYGTMIIDKPNALLASATTGYGAGGSSTTATKLLWNVPDTANNPISLTSLPSGTVTLGGQHVIGTLTLAGDVTLNSNNSNQYLTAASGGLVDITGQIKPATGVTSAAITKIGTGVVRLSRAAGNTYQGDTIIRTGTLVAADNSDLEISTNPIYLGNTTSEITNPDVALLTDHAVTISRNITVVANSSTRSSAIGVTITSGTATFSGNIALAHNSLTSVAGGTVDFTGTLDDAAGGLGITKVGNDLLG